MPPRSRRPRAASPPERPAQAARVPGATYRLQLHPGLGFRATRELLPHLQALGITDLYLSPIFRARRGSRHGYDVVDPTRLNPELGTERDFEAQFSRREAPETLPSWTPAGGGDLGIKDLLVQSGLAKSGNDAWRAVDQGAVSIDGVKIVDRHHRQPVRGPFVLRLGRKMVRVTPPAGSARPGGEVG